MENKKYEFVESADTIHGRLLESVHLSGYTMERACIGLEWLLENDRWKKVGKGFSNINDFLETINLSQFRIAIDQRKKLAKRLEAMQASQRSSAKALGVGIGTINRDLEVVPNGTKQAKKNDKNQQNENVFVPNGTSSPLSLPGREAAKAAEGKALNLAINSKPRESEPIPILPKNKYQVILADPPWKYPHTQEFYGQDVEKHYKTLTIEELCTMPIKNMAADDCVLYLWTTSPLLEKAFEVIKAWGFEYKTCMIWDKVKHNMGFYCSVRHELLLIAGIGSSKPEDASAANQTDSVYVEERTEHSKKPEFFYGMIEKLHTGKLKKIELFARNKRAGWDAWGNE